MIHYKGALVLCLGSFSTEPGRAPGRHCPSGLKKEGLYTFTGHEKFLEATGTFTFFHFFPTHLSLSMLTLARLVVDPHQKQQLRFSNASVFIRASFKEAEFLLLLHLFSVSCSSDF